MVGSDICDTLHGRASVRQLACAGDGAIISMTLSLAIDFATDFSFEVAISDRAKG
jgi:hypothetical protein